MKELEAGCLAVVLHDGVYDENVGKAVRVVRFIPGNTAITVHAKGNRLRALLTKGAWLVEGGPDLVVPVASAQVCYNGAVGNGLYRGNELLRLDDPEAYKGEANPYVIAVNVGLTFNGHAPRVTCGGSNDKLPIFIK